MKTFKEFLSESTPPGMEDWVQSNKERFKYRYGSKWQERLYATAWSKYKGNKKLRGKNKGKLKPTRRQIQ